MHERLESLVDTVVALIDVFQEGDIPYAFGGAIALSAWSEPRATTDVDLNIWVDDEGLSGALDRLEAAGVAFARDQATSDAKHRGMFQGRHGGYRIDVFVPSVPFYDEALSRRAPVNLAGRDTWVLSAECLAVFKMLFFRPKDIVDVARLLEVSSANLDVSFVREHLVDMMGDDDERVAKWDELVDRG